VIGKTLSRYKILSKLGEGGMGEVYLAEDTELGREVALKVLPPIMEESPERLERFRREARAVASLNHPNIVTLFNVEEARGRHLLVMERVRGKSLDRIIPPGGMPLAEVFAYAIPMADALAAAHEKGITHRDLKPANVMITDDGQVKVLDFGLAKLAVEGLDQIPVEDAATAAPTEAAVTSTSTTRSKPQSAPCNWTRS
jgi:serine/threonine protein kinase